MKKVMVKNMKLILGIIIGVVLAGTISVYALYIIHAKDVSYTSTNENFNAENVNDALDYLYEKENVKNSIYIPEVMVNITPERGGYGHSWIYTNNLKKLSVGTRTHGVVAGTTYFKILGVRNENCSGEYENILSTTSQSSTKEVFDISEYSCICFVAECVQNGGPHAWSSYTFKDIHLYNE